MVHAAGRQKSTPQKHKTQRMLGFATILSYFVKAPYGVQTGWISELLTNEQSIKMSLQQLCELGLPRR